MDHSTQHPLKATLINLNNVLAFSMIRFINDVFKRFFDIIASFIGLILLSPLFVLIAILIKRDSPGPVFYWGLRMGKRECTFRILKFRTMYENDQSYQGPRITQKEDNRITPFGHWLRDTKINELPQLWNVLIGEMSLVGPRPEDVEIAKEWPEKDRKEILSMRPGITSPASILYHDEENLLSSSDVMGDYFTSVLPDKMRLDRLYVRNHTAGSDIDILFWTAIVIIPNMVSIKIPEGYLFSGVVSRLVNRYISWFVLDLLSSFLSVAFAGVLWRLQGPLDWGLPYLTILTIILAVLFSGINFITRNNRIEWSRATVEDSLGLVFSGGIVTLTVLGFNFLQSLFSFLPFPALPESMIFTIGLMATIGFIVTRYRLRLVTAIAQRWLNMRRGLNMVGEHALIVGLGEGSEAAAWFLRRKNFKFAFTYIGIVDDDCYQKYGMWVDGCQVLGRISDIPKLVEKYDIGLILVTTPHIPSDLKEQTIKLCKDSQIQLVFLDKFIKLLDTQLTPFKDYVESEINMEMAIVHDDITGLPNLSLFQDRLKKSLALAKRYKTHPAVLHINITELKNVERVHGHEAKDKVIKEISERLHQQTRESDTLARLREFEFAMILEGIPDQTTIDLIIARISSCLSEPFKLNGRVLRFHAKFSYPMDEDISKEVVL